MQSGAVIIMIIWFINNSLTDYSSGIIHYNGFLPRGLDLFLPLIFTFLSLIYFGATVEDIFGKPKDNDTKERVE